MSKPLRALLIDDSPEDVELLVCHLESHGYDVTWERVDSAAGLRAALASRSWDVAICDYVMPGFSGLKALSILREEAPDLPAITSSGQVGEEYAVEVMRAGARDYVRKDNLARLVPAIEREMGEAGHLQEVRDALTLANTSLQLAAQAARIGFFVNDLHAGTVSFSTEWKANLGYGPTEIGNHFSDFAALLHPEERERVVGSIRADIAAGDPGKEREFRLRHRDGSYSWFLSRSVAELDSSRALRRIVGIHIDITERKRIEAELGKAGTHYQQLLETATDGIHVLNQDGRLEEASPSFYRMLGYAPQNPPPLQVADWDVQWSPAELRTRIASLVRQPEVFETRHRRANGDVIDVEINARGIEIDEQLYLYASARDITERKRAEAALKVREGRLRELTDCLPQLVWTCLADGPCDYLNEQWIAYTGIPASEQLGFGWLLQVHPDDREPVSRSWIEARRTGSSFDTEYRLRRSDGLYRWFTTRAVPFLDADGNIIRWLGSSTDCDDQKRLEKEIRDLNADLEKRVAERTAILETVNQGLNAFNRSISHDLRAPLRHIQAFTQLLENDLGPQVPEAQRRHLARVTEAAARMNDMITALMSLSRVGRANGEMCRLELTEIAAASFADLRAAAAVPEVAFVVHSLPEVHGDPILLRQMFDNLLGNALKFTRPVSAPKIEIGVETRDGDDVFYVRDNGVGFEASSAQNLFSAFQRYHSENDFEGTGVGLSVVKLIVERHGGRVWADSAPGQGATFWFTLG